MAMTQYNGDPEVISKLGTTPQERGLTTEQFKAKFDEGLKAFVTWFNDTHKTDFNAVETDLAEHQADNVNDADGVHGFKTESGTFTPKIVGLIVEGSTTYINEGNNTYTKNIGFYTKQGNLVNVSIAISMSAKDAALSGALVVSGLPFPAVFEAEYYAAPSINWGGFLLSAGRTQMSGYLGGGGTAIVLQQCGAGLQALLMDQTNLTDTSSLTITLTYRTQEV